MRQLKPLSDIAAVVLNCSRSAEIGLEPPTPGFMCAHPACAAGDATCRVWGAASGECVASIEAESGPVNYCCFAHLPAMAGAGAEQRHPSALLLTCHIQQQRREGRIMLWDVCQVGPKLLGSTAHMRVLALLAVLFVPAPMHHER